MNNEVADRIMKIIDDTYNMMDKISIGIIKFYYGCYKDLELELIVHENKRPMKIFKNKFNNWLIEKGKLEREKQGMLDKIVKEYKDMIK